MQRVLVVRETATPAGPYAPWRNWLPGLACRADFELWLVDAVRPVGLPGLPSLRFVHAPVVAAAERDAGCESHLAEVIAKIVPSDDDRQAGRLRAWLDLLDVIEPDRLVTDLSPMARLAARIRSVPVIDVGHSWLIPPRGDDLPDWQGIPPGGAHEPAQQKLLGRLNESLRSMRVPMLSSLADLWGPRQDALVYGGPELDFFAQADAPGYLGGPGRCCATPAAEVGGDVCVLAVLHSGYRRLRSCLDVLSEPPFGAAISVIGADETLATHFENDTMTWQAAEAVPPCPRCFDLLLCQDDPDALMAAIAVGCPVVMIATVPISAALARLARQLGQVRLIETEPSPEVLRRTLLDVAAASVGRSVTNGDSAANATDLGAAEKVNLIAERIQSP